MLIVRFMSVTGPLREEKRMKVANTEQALYEVTEHYAARGFSNFALRVDEEWEDHSWRVTAMTPGGRNDRNVAFVEYECKEPQSWSIDNIGRMKKLHRSEGGEMSFRQFCIMWADKHRHINGSPLPYPSDNDDSYAAMAYRVCKVRHWKTPDCA